MANEIINAVLSHKRPKNAPKEVTQSDFSFSFQPSHLVTVFNYS